MDKPLIPESHQTKILIIDDEKDVLKSLRDTLAAENFSVLTALMGQRGIEIALEERPGLILLDLRLPDMDGYDVCRALKSKAETAPIPIIMVSTRSKDTEKVIGLEIGADDYLTKPYNASELLARIRAVLRRTAASGTLPISAVLEQGPVVLDREARRVKVQGEPVKLTRKEFDLLVTLMTKPGKAYSRAALLEIVWGAAYESMNGTVDTHVKTLRAKLGVAGKWIETVTGIGYRWSENELFPWRI